MISADDMAALCRQTIAMLTDDLETETRPAMRRSLNARIIGCREAEAWARGHKGGPRQA